MKTNKMMRLASSLLVAVLLTTCIISGTYAKYVTSSTGNDIARVAKFGVEITANGSMFAKEYDTDDENVKGTIAKSVVSSNDEKVVAPGTSGNMVSMTLTGKPEVAVEVTYDIENFNLGNWALDDGTFYCPLIISVNGKDFDGSHYTDAQGFIDAITNEIKNYSKNYEANTDLTKIKKDSLNIGWQWPFSKDDNDVKDTYLGNQAANGNAATIELEIKTTVTQID